MDDSATTSDPRVGELVDGRYRVIAPMAAGSMGVVYKGERVPVGKLVAIKFLHATYASDPEFLARFERETRVMSKLAHPNCVSVVDFGVWDGAPYLVMEYVAGTTLRTLLDDQALPPRRALALARQICAGLAHAHAHGIVHRDIKPANLMISEEIGTGDHVRILDFGLARLRGAAGRDATQNNVVVGTPNYMAPEQTIGGGLIDARTDVYAVGVVLFEMITGERPFRAEDTLALLGMHRAAPIPKLADRVERDVQLPIGLQAVIDRAMAKAAEDRFQSAIEFAGAIDEVIASCEEPSARRSSAAKKLAVAPTMLDVSRADAVGPASGSSTRVRRPRIARALAFAGIGLAAATGWFTVQSAGDPAAAAQQASSTTGEGSGLGSAEHGAPLPGADVSAGAPTPVSGEPSLAVSDRAASATNAPAAENAANANPATAAGVETAATAAGVENAANATAASATAASATAANATAASATAAGSAANTPAANPPAAASGPGAMDPPTVAAGAGAPSPGPAPSAVPAAGAAAAAGPHASGAPPLAVAAAHADGKGEPGAALRVVDATGGAAGDTELDPATAEDPAPASSRPANGDDEAANAPTSAAEVETHSGRAATPGLATTLPAAVQLIRDGKRDLALASLNALWKKAPASSYIPFLLGNLYYDRLWWAVAIDHYGAAIKKNARYRANPTLNRNVIKMLASRKSARKAEAFLRHTVGRPALPYVKFAAQHDGSAEVRKRSGWLARGL